MSIDITLRCWWRLTDHENSTTYQGNEVVVVPQNFSDAQIESLVKKRVFACGFAGVKSFHFTVHHKESVF